jgi:hypothetical protein
MNWILVAKERKENEHYKMFWILLKKKLKYMLLISIVFYFLGIGVVRGFLSMQAIKYDINIIYPNWIKIYIFP